MAAVQEKDSVGVSRPDDRGVAHDKARNANTLEEPYTSSSETEPAWNSRVEEKARRKYVNLLFRLKQRSS